MLKIELSSFYYHKYDCEWHFSVLLLENDFEYGDSRSFFGAGRKDEMWFFDLAWMRILPRSYKDE